MDINAFTGELMESCEVCDRVFSEYNASPVDGVCGEAMCLAVRAGESVTAALVQDRWPQLTAHLAEALAKTLAEAIESGEVETAYSVDWLRDCMKVWKRNMTAALELA